LNSRILFQKELGNFCGVFLMEALFENGEREFIFIAIKRQGIR